MTTAQLPSIPEESEFLTHSIHGVEILVRKSDGYCYATAMCRAAGKQFGHYRSNTETESYLAVIEKEIGIPISKLVQMVKGRNHKQGTWVHPDVALHLAQWLSPEVAYAVTKIVKAWMTGKSEVEPEKQMMLPPEPRKTVTTIITMEDGVPPKSVTYEGKVVLVPAEEYQALNKHLSDAFHAHHMDVMNRVSDFLLTNLSINNPDKARKAVSNLKELGIKV